ncbi:PREDICTED: proline-rich protein 29 [Tinamus guttatus]|uniref:proline-rich protein 29 n=1 Tax=Tinamus guttatus TaxID=94827 RepID=UPI00052F0425|nr:PREDICTED: proline-rich protein 29 [Tinamus guttatus]
MDMGEAGDPDGTWTDTPEGTYIAPHVVPQQPLMILQQLPGTVGDLTQPARPQRVRGDLIELLMIQNSQMHQVVMNSLVVSALMSFGLGPSPSSAQMTVVPWHTNGEEEAAVFHHHYVPYLSSGAFVVLPVPAPAQAQAPAAVHYLGPVSAANDEEVVVPPPPPPSATGTVGANVPPASEYYDLEEGRL